MYVQHSNVLENIFLSAVFVPVFLASEVSATYDYSRYIASLEFKRQNGTSQNFHLTAQQPHFLNSYVCEYAGKFIAGFETNLSSIRTFVHLLHHLYINEVNG